MGKGGFDVVVFCGVFEIFCDDLDPCSNWSADWAFVGRQIKLQCFLCRCVYVKTKDVSQECQTSSLYLFRYWDLFCDAVQFCVADDLWIFNV